MHGHRSGKRETYLGPHLVYNMTAGQIPHLMWITDGDIKCRIGSLLDTDAGLGLSFRTVCLTGGLHRRGVPKPRTIFLQAHRIGHSSSAGSLRRRRRGPHISPGEGLLLRWCGSLIRGGGTGVASFVAERTQRIEGIINGFQFCRLCTDLAGAPGTSSYGRADGVGARLL